MRPFVTAPGATPAAWRPAALTGLGAAPALGGLCWALCAYEARKARSGPRPYEHALPADGLLGDDGRPALRITWLGDSLATGLGVDHVDHTPAHVVARMLERPVEVRMLAVPGSRACHVIEDQLPRLRGDEDLVVLCVGANDVATTMRRTVYAEQLDAILTALAPTPVVMLTLPDMAMADRMAQPLRSLAGARARWFEAARTKVASRHRHVTSVDIASRPAAVSRREGRTWLCADRFHPGPQGYRVWAERIAQVIDGLLHPNEGAAPADEVIGSVPATAPVPARRSVLRRQKAAVRPVEAAQPFLGRSL